MAELNDKEFKDFNEIVQNTLNSLIDCADKHNIDRDSFIKYFGAIFGTMAKVSTFTNYTLKHLRQQAGLKQEFVAFKLGVSQQAVSNWELGKRKPNREHLSKLAKLYGCEPTDLKITKET